MKILAAIFFLCPSLLFASQEDNWLAPISSANQAQLPIEEISEKDFFEVSASKKATAERRLENSSIVAIQHDAISYFGQSQFQCGVEKHPYLIRAVYQNGGSGNYFLKRYGSTLLVVHGSMGNPSPSHRSALVACLDFQPTEIFVQLTGAL